LFILIITGVLLALIINFIYGKFSGRLIKISIINSMSLAGGVLLNLFITRILVLRIKTPFIFLISFGLIAGVSISGFIYIFFLEPFFFLYGSSLLQSYFLINFVFALSLTIISSGFLVYQQRLLEKEKVITTERLLRKDMEQKLYSARINPHFLFNTLNLMISLIPTPQKAEDALTTLSELLRYHLDVSAMNSVFVSTEIANIKKYLYLQKLRFGDKLNFSINEEIDCPVPPLIIQPLVENSVKHNIKKVKSLFINIDVVQKDSKIIIHVIDSCRNLTSKMVGTGTGLTITKKRTELVGGNFIIENGGIKLEFPDKRSAVKRKK